MTDIHRTLEILGQAVANMLDRIESLEAENAALIALVSPSPLVPVADVPQRVVTGITVEEDRE